MLHNRENIYTQGDIGFQLYDTQSKSDTKKCLSGFEKMRRINKKKYLKVTLIEIKRSIY